MIRIGASTANLYPLETERALDCLLELGFRELEVFLNTESEAEETFIRRLRAPVPSSARCIRTFPGQNRICCFPLITAGMRMV